MLTLLGPAIALVGRLGLIASLFLVGALLFLGAVVALYIAAIHAGSVAQALRRPLELGLCVGVLLMAGVYLILGVAWWSRTGMERIARAAERMASGDLALRLGARDADGDAERIWSAMRDMSANLAEIVSSVRSSSEAILQGAGEIAAGYASLSERTEQQASTLEETASAMEELSATVRQNADSCRSAEGSAQEAARTTDQCAEDMRRLLAMMQRIDSDAKRVGEIVGVIEGIAFQTNILALNAAVEASRAGEHGRGFGVVASEVRSLAQKSAAAAKDIKSLISQSQDGVSAGSQVAVSAGDTVKRAAERVKDVSAMIVEIARASAEQTKGIEEVNKAIMQLERATQQNAALVEQATAAATEFEDQARGLAETVDAFKLDRADERDQAMALVKRAIAHIKACGIERAVHDFHDPRGGFMQGELYVVVFDERGVVLALGASPERAGESFWDVVDADGKKNTQEIIRVGKARGVGWVDYRWRHPATGQIQPKSTYLERVGEYIVACGIYRSERVAKAPQARLPHLSHKGS